jgi:3-hydroxyisobutyrate dehydrogenase-like beta-hydroxyacid dehydrogenase
MEGVGVVGLGAMGRPLAARLLERGFPVTVAPHRSREAVEALRRQGARVVETFRDVARASRAVILLVPDAPEVEEAAFGPHGLVEGAAEGATVIVMSTISPLAAQRIAARLADRGIAMLDAPVSGGPSRAATGELTIMVGGETTVLDRVRPVLEAAGSRIFHVGPVGMGEVVKLCNNLLIGIIMIANAEAFTFGVKAGIKAEVLKEVLSAATGQNFLLDRWVPLTLLKDAYQPGFGLNLMLKDLNLIVQTAKDLGVPLFEGTMAQQLFALSRGLGRGELDYSAVSLLYQEAAGVTIATGAPRATGR